ncbi:hypothetical protein QTG54_015553 [Skeletonema marinoi]|uniref:Uncharacterized protein n=1 Tax=Skeletonema marinoi TaxID=267567 RepID=A0AAD8XUJ5_9STRA|nr:hypothetical protein QTG54_015553 [Skeletonema marinoi]
MMMQSASEQSCSESRLLHYDSPASSYKKGGAPGNNLVASPITSYLSPKSKAFLSPSENVGVTTPPTSKASSSPGGDDDYSPISNYSRESSGSGIIDHTALLLGLHDELEDESDDEARHCCFSPMASVDALDGEIDPDDDYDDDDNNNSDSDELETVGSYDGPPLQLAIDTNRGVMTVSDNNIVGTDLSLVATQLDLDVQEGTVTKAVDESGETVSKAASMKAKASSVFSAKAQKAKQKTLDVIAPKITLMATRKSEQRINDELSAASSKGKLAAKQASEMVSSMKDKAAQKAHEVKDKAAQKAHKVKDITLEVVGRKAYHKADELSHNGSEAISLLSDDVGSEGSVGTGSAKATATATATQRAIKKLPNLPRPPKTLFLKKGTINKKFMSSIAAKRTQNKATIDQSVEQHQHQQQSSVCSPGPSSIISPTNSYDMSSCIDADGFLLSPQSSLGFISPTASIDEYSGGIDNSVAFDAFSDTDRFDNFESSSTSRVPSNTDDDGELLSKELKAAIQSKARKPPLLPPSGRPRQK